MQSCEAQSGSFCHSPKSTQINPPAAVIEMYSTAERIEERRLAINSSGVSVDPQLDHYAKFIMPRERV